MMRGKIKMKEKIMIGVIIITIASVTLNILSFSGVLEPQQHTPVGTYVQDNQDLNCLILSSEGNYTYYENNEKIYESDYTAADEKYNFNDSDIEGYFMNDMFIIKHNNEINRFIKISDSLVYPN